MNVAEISMMLPNRFRKCAEKVLQEMEIEEVRIRINKPLMFYDACNEYEIEIEEKNICSKDMNEIIQYISGYSLYAFENELREGFITVKGGHRVGIAGKFIIEDKRVKNIVNISSINLRISRELTGITNGYDEKLLGDGAKNILIISPPGAGKTTLLREIIRIASDKYKLICTVVDERGEIAASYKGIPSKNVGKRTDVLDCCPKEVGMMMAIRALAPDVVAVDEIGSDEDVLCINKCGHCGIKIVSTIHGENIEDISSRNGFGEMIKSRFFDRYILLKNVAGRRSVEIYDNVFKRLE